MASAYWHTYDATDILLVNPEYVAKKSTSGSGGARCQNYYNTLRRAYAVTFPYAVTNTSVGFAASTATITDQASSVGKYRYYLQGGMAQTPSSIAGYYPISIAQGDTLFIYLDYSLALSAYGLVYMSWYDVSAGTWTALNSGAPVYQIDLGSQVTPYVEFGTAGSEGSILADFMLEDRAYPAMASPYIRWNGAETVTETVTNTFSSVGVPGGTSVDEAVVDTPVVSGDMREVWNEALADSADGSEGFMFAHASRVTEVPVIVSVPAVQMNTSATAVNSVVAVSPLIVGQDMSLTSTANASTSTLYTIIQQFFESVAATSTAAVSSTINSANLYDAAAGNSVIVAAFNQILADTVNSTSVWNVSSAAVLADYLVATQVVSSTHRANVALAETLVALDAWTNASQETVVETITVTANHVAQVQALVAMLETAQAVDVGTARVTAIQLVNEGFVATELTDFTGSTLNALIDDGVVVLVKVNIGGELFTGWVMNAETTAASEYQFADKQFNSACKHGTRYLMSAEDGIYAFTEDTTAESVMTYIKTGKMDFGSDLKKRIVNSYIVYSASGDMTLKVTTSEYGQLVTRDYRMVPPSDSETTDTRRVDIGRGIRSRYWQFEIVGDGVDCTIDEVGMLPVVLSRRF